MFAGQFPAVAQMLLDAKADLSAFADFPDSHWRKIWSTNPLERLNREVKRRTGVVGNFPNPAALLRLSSCVLIEAHDEWQDSDRRYLSEESMALLNPPAPTFLEPKTATPDTTPSKEIAATASLPSLAQHHATSYTTPGDATLRRRRRRLPLGVARPVVRPRGLRRAFGLSAVAPEPWPFWDGDDQDQRVTQWQEAVGWRQDWGQVVPAGRLNGSSGLLVRDRVLTPLRLTLADVWLTDAVPFFFVHRGPGKQGEAMSERYDPFAAALGLPPHALPDRPSPRRLVELAVTEERGRPEEELQTADAPLLSTLGNEALAVADALLDQDLPNRLSPDDSYGTRLPTQRGSR